VVEDEGGHACGDGAHASSLLIILEILSKNDVSNYDCLVFTCWVFNCPSWRTCISIGVVSGHIKPNKVLILME
jgi:hypothetical protein